MGYKISNLLELIKSDTSIKDIKSILNISDKELLNKLKILKKSGIIIDKKIQVSCSNSLEFKDNSNSIRVHMDKNQLRVFIISDIHMFNKDESKEAIYKIYDYCLSNNINIILICGDLIDSIDNNKTNIEKQGEEFIKNYPYDENITNISLMGNHEYLYYLKTGIDFNEMLNNERLDFKSIGYKNGHIFLKNDFISLSHPINNCCLAIDNKIEPRIIFKGHSHFCEYNDSCIHVPSLSYVSTHNKNYLPAPMGLDVTFDFKEDGTIKYMTIDQLIIGDEIFILNTNKIHTANKPITRIKKIF